MTTACLSRRLLSLAVGGIFGLTATAAAAQDTQPTAPTPPATATGTVSGSVEAPAPPRVTTRTVVDTGGGGGGGAAVKEEDTTPDHEKFVGRFAIGYMGVTNLPIGGGAAGAAPQQLTVPAPILGGRYWLSKLIGIDAGIGIALGGSSVEVQNGNTDTTTDGPSIFGGALHGGVPLALAAGKHYTFEVIPEFNAGFTSRTEKSAVPNNPPPDLHHSGFRLDVGARVGTEIHFGFIGVPELALQATVGLYFQRQVWHNSQDAGTGVPNALSSSIGQTTFGTTVQSDPWALFVNNISALYYF